MILAKVVGHMWSSKKNEKLHALRTLIVQPLTRDLEPTGDVLVVVDEIGAGADEMVLVTRGAPAAHAFPQDKPIPVDAVVVGIVDSLDLYTKE